MPKRKSQTFEEQAERFRREAEKRIAAGLPSIDDADAAVDERIRRNIQEQGA